MNRQRELAYLAMSMVGITEEFGKDNCGEWIEKFQKSVDGKASGEAWCMAFCMFLLEEIDTLFGESKRMSIEGHELFKSEHCMTVWKKSAKEHRLEEPEIGSLVIWRHGKTDLGHCGIVVNVIDDMVETIEGNTSSSDGIERNGDGVFYKIRKTWKTTGKMQTVGYLKPWMKR